VQVIQHTSQFVFGIRRAELQFPNSRLFAFVGGLAILLCGILLMTSAVKAQVLTGDILGTVTDKAGAVLPNATVTVTNKGTNEVHVVRTTDAGEFTVTLLPVGDYSVKVEAAGFKVYTVASIPLSGGDRARVSARLEVGQATETIEVTSVAPALQTDTSSIQQTVAGAAVQDLPLNGRNFISLATLAPGATQGGPNAMSGGTRPDDRRQSSAISVNGQFETMNNYLIDGMDNNDRYIATIGVRPSVDAMQEFSVKTNLYSAEITRTAGGVINIITKSGTNQFHGTAFEFLRNDIADASSNYNFTGGKPLRKGEYRQNQFGASIGGPIKKDKAFAFGDYEDLRIIQGVAFTGLQVPDSLERTGNFSELSTPIMDPTTGSQFSGNIIPPSRIDQTIKNLVALIPPATNNIPGPNYQNNVNRTQYQTTYDIRVDDQISSKDTIFGRYSFNNVNTFTPNAFPAVGGILGGGCYCATGNGFTINPTGSFSGPAQQRSQNVQINYSHIFTPNLVFNARAGYLRYALQSLPDNALGAPNAANTMGIPNADIAGNKYAIGLPLMVLFPYASLGDQEFVPELVYDDAYQENDDIHYTKGAHTFAAGFAAIRRYVYLNQSSQPKGFWAFNSTPPSGYTTGTNDTFAAFLLDLPVTFSRNIQLVTFGSISDEWGSYIQDDWRVTHSLTLNLGGRWDIFMPFSARHGLMSEWNPVTNSLAIPGVTPNVNDRANIQPDYHDFAPRIGFAETILPGLVVRGGYGISYYEGLVSTAPYGENVPYYFSTTTNCGNNAVKCPTVTQGPPIVPSSVNYALAQNTNLNGTITAINPTIRNPYVQQWSLNLQKDFSGNVVGLGYVGNVGHGLPQGINQNLGVNPSFGGPTVPRPLSAAGVFNIVGTPGYPTAGGYNQPNITLNENSGYSNYNAMQLTVDRRTQRGLTINAQYTFAKGMSNAGSTQSIGGNGGLQWLANRGKFDYGRTGLDVRQHVAVLANYELPLGNSLTGLAGYVAKGWQVNTVIQFSSGLPLTVINPSNRLGISGGGADRPNQIAKVTYPHTLKRWFNPADFQLNPIGFPGNTQVYDVQGPHFRSWDLSIMKLFPVGEHDNLQFRMEGFNILNMPNFLNPNGTIGSASFSPTDSTTWGTLGTITGLAGPPRQFQAALKFIF
jgi:hypothetical protein